MGKSPWVGKISCHSQYQSTFSTVKSGIIGFFSHWDCLLWLHRVAWLFGSSVMRFLSILVNVAHTANLGSFAGGTRCYLLFCLLVPLVFFCHCLLSLRKRKIWDCCSFDTQMTVSQILEGNFIYIYFLYLWLNVDTHAYKQYFHGAFD